MSLMEHITDGGVDHWADVVAAGDLARHVLDIASDAHERELSGPAADRDAQTALLRAAVDGVATMYRVANLSPTTDPAWLGIIRQAYGETFDHAAGTITVPEAPTTWLARQAAQVFASATGARQPFYKIMARLWLAPDAMAMVRCVPPVAGDDCEQFAPGSPGVGQAHPDGAACAAPLTDWACESWRVPPEAGAAGNILHPSVWSLALLRRIASIVVADPRAWVLQALRGGAVPLDPSPPAEVRQPEEGAAPPPEEHGETRRDDHDLTTGEEVATMGPILLGGLLILAVLFGQSVRPPKPRR